jgi:hypothetical protein
MIAVTRSSYRCGTVLDWLCKALLPQELCIASPASPIMRHASERPAHLDAIDIQLAIQSVTYSVVATIYQHFRRWANYLNCQEPTAIAITPQPELRLLLMPNRF